MQLKTWKKTLQYNGRHRDVRSINGNEIEKERDTLATTDVHKSASTTLKISCGFSSEITRITYRIISAATNQSVNSRGT
jgi:hypothetical protein